MEGRRKRGRKPKIREESETGEVQSVNLRNELEPEEKPVTKRGRKPKLQKPQDGAELPESAQKPIRSNLKKTAQTYEIFQGPLHQPDPLRKPGKSILKKSTRKRAISPRMTAPFRPGSTSTDGTDSDESMDKLEVQPKVESVPAGKRPVEMPELQPECQPESNLVITDSFELGDQLDRQPEPQNEVEAQKEPAERPELQPESQQNSNVIADPVESANQLEVQPELKPQNELKVEQEPGEQPELQPESRRLKQVTIRYRGRPFTMRPLFKEKMENGEDRTLIDDTLVDFYMSEYMVHDVFDDENRAETHVFNSFFYTGLRDRIDCKIKVTPRRWELADLFKQLYPKFNMSIFEKKILVVPIYIHKPKHWLLVLIHNPLGATLRLRPPREPEKLSKGAKCSIGRVMSLLEDSRPVEYLDEQCRILLLDSLRGSEQFREMLAEEYENIFQCLRFFILMMAAARGEEAFSSKIKQVVCRVPRQKNHVDCGFFMITYAEYFTTRFTEWTKWSIDALKFLRIDDFTKEHLRSNGPRESIDRLIKLLTEY